MASITIRNLDPGLKRALRLRAAEHDRSMEEEARDILRHALAEQDHAGRNLAEVIRARVAPLGGVDLPEVAREPAREPPALDDSTRKDTPR
jgi:plasmid stability protein